MNDSELVAGAQDGDPAAFAELIGRYEERILRLVRGMVPAADVEDVAQEAFLKAFRKLHLFDGRSSFYTWIYRIAVNHITNYLKKERRRRWVNLLDRTVSDVVHDEGADPSYVDRVKSPGPDQKMEANERAQIVWAAVRSLSIKYRVPLVLFHYEGLSYNDIAESMGLSLSAVESRIHRAKKQLIKKLEPWAGKI